LVAWPDARRLSRNLGQLDRSRARKRRNRAEGAEGGPSGSSGKCAAGLDGIEHLYRSEKGSGISELVRAASTSIDERVRDAFTRANAALTKMSEPLERAVVSDRPTFEMASAAIKTLRSSIQSEVASALELKVGRT
jgi:predicted lipoprotein